MSLTDKPAAVVTGAAQGIGRELALALARRGGRVVVADIDGDGAERTAAELGSSALAVRCDVRREHDVAALARAATDWLGDIDVVVNNAGVLVTGEAADTQLDDYHRVIDVNLWGVIHGCRQFAPIMKRRGSGHIINIASLAGAVAMPLMGPYSATKAAVIALSEALHAELASSGVSVTVVCPSFTRTGLLDASTGPANTRTMDAARAIMARIGASPRRVAHVALKAAEHGSLYAIPTLHGRAVWGVKRLLPERFKHVTRWLHARVA